MNLLAVAWVQIYTVHELAWLCLGLCVYMAECELTCYCFQRGVSHARLIPQDAVHTHSWI